MNAHFWSPASAFWVLGLLVYTTASLLTVDTLSGALHKLRKHSTNRAATPVPGCSSYQQKWPHPKSEPHATCHLPCAETETLEINH